LPSQSVYRWIPDIVFLVLAILLMPLLDSSTRVVGVFLLLLSALLVSLTDFWCNMIPDRITVPLAAVGLLVSLFPADVSFADALIGGAVGFGSFWLISISASAILRRPALGGGDIKLAGALGIFLGWSNLILCVFIASVIGLLYVIALRPRQVGGAMQEVAFGPALAVAGVLVFVWGNYWLEQWMQLVDI